MVDKQEYPIEVRKKVATEVMANSNFLELVTRAANFTKQANELVVDSIESEGTAADLDGSIRATLAAMDAFRLESTSAARMYTSAVNGAFKPISGNMEKARKVIGEKVQKERREREQREKERIAAEQKEIRDGQVLNTESGAVNNVEVLQNVPEVVVENKVEGQAASFHEMSKEVVLVEDKMKLIKSVISTAKGKEHITMKLLDVNMAELEKLMLEDGKKVPGAKVDEVKTLVNRTLAQK